MNRTLDNEIDILKSEIDKIVNDYKINVDKIIECLSI